jgi:hypothetical protein
VGPAQELEDDMSCGLRYQPAFFPSCPIPQDNKAAVRSQESIESMFCIQRPVEIILLTLAGISLSLGLGFSTIVVTLTIKALT